MALRKCLLFLGAVGLAAGLAGCGVYTAIFGSAPATPPPAGSAAVIGLDNYPVTQTCEPAISPYPSEAASSTASTLSSEGWNTVSTVNPPSFSNANFTSYMGNNALFFFGHGQTGVVAFPSLCSYQSGAPSTTYWGIGDSADNLPKATGALPSGSQLYWMFLFSSYTVAPDTNQEVGEDAQYAANPWDPLFYQSGLPLRAMFGYYGYPGSCWCDVVAPNNPPVAAELLRMIAPNSSSASSTIFNAWQQSNEDNNESAAWSAEIDANAMNDTFSTVGLDTRDGAVNFLYPSPSPSPYAVIVVSPTTGTLAPVNLVNESLNVAGAVSEGDTDFSAGTYTTASSGGLTNYTSVGGLQVSYYQGLSGGVTYHSQTLYNPMAVTEPSAEAAAVSFIDNSFGMPSDAVLVDTLSFYKLESNGSAVLTGYEFVFNHASGTMYGGDAIKVDVEDYHYVSSTKCVKEIILPPPAKPECTEYEYTYADKPNISLGYRLWRSIGSAATTTKSGYRAETATIDAYTASLALPDSDDVTAYALGYWTGPLSQASGIAEPVWIYHTSGGRIYAVDAGSGALIGTQTQ